jgi:hypothetical protein
MTLQQEGCGSQTGHALKAGNLVRRALGKLDCGDLTSKTQEALQDVGCRQDLK